MRKKYIIFHKPYNVLSQFTSDKGLNNLSTYNLPPHIYAAGRLDKDSEGILLLTNDGQFQKLFLDNHPRQYLVQVDGHPSKKSLDELQSGVLIKGKMTKPCHVELVQQPNIPARNPPIRYRKNIPTNWLKITLYEGRNRQVRRMTASIGHPTLRLIRIGVGKLKLDLWKELPPGKWMTISPESII